MNKQKTFIFSFCLALGFSMAPLKISALEEKTYPIKNLRLYKNVYHDVKVPNAKGKKLDIKGNYKGRFGKVQYNPQTKILRFYPRKEGEATLILKDSRSGKVLYEFRVNIQKTNLFRISKEVRALLPGIDGITIKILNNRVVIDGQVLLPKEIARIESVLKEYPGVVTSFVTLSAVGVKKIARIIARDISAIAPGVTVRTINGIFILEGEVDTAEQKQKIKYVTEAYLPDLVRQDAKAGDRVGVRSRRPYIDLITVAKQEDAPPKPLIQVVLHYVELKKDYGKNFRFNWAPSLADDSNITITNGGNQGASTTTTLTGIISSLFPKLNWAKSHGYARILNSGTIVVQAEQKGTLSDGLEIPFQTTGPNGATSIQYHKVDYQTSVTPTVVGKNSNSVKLNVQFQLKAPLGADGQVSSKSVRSVLVVPSGKSAALGGLIRQSKTMEFNKPGRDNASNPIFSFLTGREKSKSQSQFVVFITPIIKSSATEGSDKIKRKFKLKY